MSPDRSINVANMFSPCFRALICYYYANNHESKSKLREVESYLLDCDKDDFEFMKKRIHDTVNPSREVLPGYSDDIKEFVNDFLGSVEKKRDDAKDFTAIKERAEFYFVALKDGFLNPCNGASMILDQIERELFDLDDETYGMTVSSIELKIQEEYMKLNHFKVVQLALFVDNFLDIVESNGRKN